MFRRRPRPEGLDELIEEHLGAGDPTGWFEPAYARANRRIGHLPWASGQPHPYVSDWLDDPVLQPTGRRAVVVGCGLGDDAAELHRHGYDVVAFDVSKSAVEWASKRFDAPIDWRVLDLLQAEKELQESFDLVVEVRTVQSLPGVVRDAAMHAVGSLAAPGGVVLVVTLLAINAEVARDWRGPPWAQAPSELAAYRAAGLEQIALEHPDPGEDGSMEVRITWQRGPDTLPIVADEGAGGP